MRFVIGLAQSGYPQGSDVLEHIESFVVEAERSGVRLLAFPENLMCPHMVSESELRGIAQPIDGPFLRGVRSLAAKHGMWIVGTMSETSPTGDLPFNTAFAIDEMGRLRGSYRKCHLYDAHSVRESQRMAKGDRLCQPIASPFGTLGLGICYDLRFPEVARAAALGGCDIVLFPSAWHDGPHKVEHWETLLRARAIENECFVAGICHAGPNYVGRSAVVNPLGEVIAMGPGSGDPNKEALVVAEVDTTEVQLARDAMPILKHRRPDLYQAVV